MSAGSGVSVICRADDLRWVSRSCVQRRGEGGLGAPDPTRRVADWVAGLVQELADPGVRSHSADAGSQRHGGVESAAGTDPVAGNPHRQRSAARTWRAISRSSRARTTSVRTRRARARRCRRRRRRRRCAPRRPRRRGTRGPSAAAARTAAARSPTPPVKTSASSPPSAAAIAAIAGAQAVDVDVEREPGAVVARRAPSTSRMSAVPASAEQARLVLERRRPSRRRRSPRARAATAAGRGRRARARRHHEPLERREAHRRVDRARRRAPRASEAPAPRWQVDDARVAPPASSSRAPPRGVGVREPVEAVAAHAPALAPRRRQRVGRRGRREVAWNAVSKHATAGTPGSARARRASSAASDLGWCSGARSVSARSAATTSASTRDRRAEALAAVDDPVADRVDRAQRRASASASAASSTSAARRGEVGLGEQRVAGAEQPQLQAARAGVDDEDAHAAALRRGPAPSRATSGMSSPTSRV